MDFYAGSGSPYVWRVWLALEHKQLPYTLKMLSFSTGDLKKPEFTALNPRQRVPVIVDDGLAVYESAAILEYLEEAYPTSGAHLFPGDVRQRALARRLVREADEYLAQAMEELVERILFTAQAQWDALSIAGASGRFASEVGAFARELRSDFFCGEPGAVDFTVYPMVALVRRIALRNPGAAIDAAIDEKVAAWARRMEALPYYAKTYPPHWKQSA